MTRTRTCHRCGPLQHPWIESITDTACGYDRRLLDADCQGCHRSRAESPRAQLEALEALGRVAMTQEDVCPD